MTIKTYLIVGIHLNDVLYYKNIPKIVTKFNEDTGEPYQKEIYIKEYYLAEKIITENKYLHILNDNVEFEGLKLLDFEFYNVFGIIVAECCSPKQEYLMIKNLNTIILEIKEKMIPHNLHDKVNTYLLQDIL